MISPYSTDVENTYAAPFRTHLEFWREREPRVLELGQLPAELQPEWHLALGNSHRVQHTEHHPGDIEPDIVLDASCKTASERIDTFKSLATKLTSGGRYFCYTGDPGEKEASQELKMYFCSLLDDLHAFHKRGKKRTALNPQRLPDALCRYTSTPHWWLSNSSLV